MLKIMYFNKSVNIFLFIIDLSEDVCAMLVSSTNIVSLVIINYPLKSLNVSLNAPCIYFAKN